MRSVQRIPEAASGARRWTAFRRRGAFCTALALSAVGLAACGSSSGNSATPTLNWYINPNSSGSYAKVAAACQKQAAGKYKLNLAVLPTTADGQREQIVRRLAAGDSSMDFANVDPPYTAELANAGWLRPFTDAERTDLVKGVLGAPIKSGIWKGKLVGAPWQANTQLLWYRKSVAQQAGIDPQSPDFTWDQMIDAAVKTGTIVGEQGKKYEGYMVWVNAMVLGAGGSILQHNDKGKDATVSINSAAAKRAAEVIKKLATSKAADPALSTADEAIALATFEGPKGGFLLNWPYVYAAFQADLKAGVARKTILSDLGVARYPRVDASLPSKPPSGGINLAVSKFSKHPAESVAAIKCIISPAMEKLDMQIAGDPQANGTLYDDPEIKKAFPMAALIRQSINDAGPRPITPFYGDVSGAIQRDWQPASGLNPGSTPAKSATLIRDVLHDKRLL